MLFVHDESREIRHTLVGPCWGKLVDDEGNPRLVRREIVAPEFVERFASSWRRKLVALGKPQRCEHRDRHDRCARHLTVSSYLFPKQGLTPRPQACSRIVVLPRWQLDRTKHRAHTVDGLHRTRAPDPVHIPEACLAVSEGGKRLHLTRDAPAGISTRSARSTQLHQRGFRLLRPLIEHEPGV